MDQSFIAEEYIQHSVKLAIEFAPKLILALVSLFVGLWVVAKLIKSFKKVALSKGWDPSLIPFVSNLIAIGLKIILFISIASLVGIQTTSLVAVLGAASLAIGLALQGSLANFAGGILILVLKPYKVGDVIETMGFIGEVKEILIFNTILVTGDQRTVILPNGSISNNSIINISKRGVRRIDMVIKIAHNSDVEKAKQLIRNIMMSYPEVHQNPQPVIEVIELSEFGISICVRPVVDGPNFWPVQFKALSDIQKVLREHQFEFPVPDMRLKKQ